MTEFLVLHCLVSTKGHVYMPSASVVSNSVLPYRLQPSGLLCPWGFSRREYWSVLPCPSPGDLPDPGIRPVSLISPASSGRFFTTSVTGEPYERAGLCILHVPAAPSPHAACSHGFILTASLLLSTPAFLYGSTEVTCLPRVLQRNCFFPPNSLSSDMPHSIIFPFFHSFNST